MATSSGAHIIQVLAVVVLSGLLAAAYAQTSEDERRPYKFGFTIENMQHRQEEKDERGIIMGEYGFITADGWYLTTIYATDEEGRFKILGRKRERVGPPQDDYSPKVTIMDEFSSPQVSTSRPPFSSTVSPTSNPITISSPRPFQTITPTTYRPTTYRPSPSSNTFVQTTATFQPSKQSQSGPFKGIAGCGSCIIPTTTSRPAVSPDYVSSTAGFRPSSGNSDRNQAGPGSFSSDRNPSNRPGSFSPSRDTSGPGSFNNDRQTTNRPGAFDRNPGFGNNNNINPSTNRPNTFNSNRNPSGPGSFNSDRQSNRPGSFDRNPSGPGNFNSVSDDDFEDIGGGFNRPSTRPTSARPFSRPNSGQFASATATTPSSILPFTRPTTRYPTAFTAVTTARPIINSGYNRPNLPPSGYGDNQQGESGLNYKFNYTTDFQGHAETGYRDGSKVGEFFYNSPDGVGQKVTYEANEFGYQPNVINVQLSAQETPRQGEDRNAQLRGSEFLWFKR